MGKLKASGEPRSKGGGGCVILIFIFFIMVMVTAWLDVHPIFSIIGTGAVIVGISVLVNKI